MLAIWLVFGDQMPDQNTGAVYGRLWKLGDALGPIGLAAAASLVAYLIGSLVQAIISLLSKRISDGGFRGMIQPYGIPEDQDLEREPWISITALGEAQDRDPYAGLPFIGGTVNRSLIRLENAELSGVRFRLLGAVRHAESTSDGVAQYRFLAWRNQLPIIGVPRPDRDLVELPIPQFSPLEDLWSNRSLLETRLRELVPSTALKIERLDGEADFREVVSLSLAVAIIVFAVQTSLFWLALITFPVALFIQALSQRRLAGNELADALRARSGTPELERITPVFMQYREQADQLADALIAANWKNPTYIQELVEAEIQRRVP